MAGTYSRVKWHGGRVAADLQKEMQRRLTKVGVMLSSQIRRNIGTSTRKHGPSVPGEFPHADTGNLRKSITYDVRSKENVVRVGTTVVYANRLETELDRSFVLRTLEEMEPQITQVLTAPMGKRKGGGRVSLEREPHPGGEG